MTAINWNIIKTPIIFLKEQIIPKIQHNKILVVALIAIGLVAYFLLTRRRAQSNLSDRNISPRLTDPSKVSDGVNQPQLIDEKNGTTLHEKGLQPQSDQTHLTPDRKPPSSEKAPIPNDDSIIQSEWEEDEDVQLALALDASLNDPQRSKVKLKEETPLLCAAKKEAEQLAQALADSKKQLPDTPYPTKPTRKVSKAPLASASTAAPAPKPNVTITPKTQPVIEKELLETTRANSEVSKEALDLSVENAKSKNLNIISHEILRNESGHPYLALRFEKPFYRTRALQELSAQHGLFDKARMAQLAQEMVSLDLVLTNKETIKFQSIF